MKEQDRNKAWGFSLFADDIRFEIGGKMSTMGLYQADMFFPDNLAFPLVLSKFCIIVMYYEIIGAIEGDVTIKVTFGPQNISIVDFLLRRGDLTSASDASKPYPEDVAPDDKERIFHSRIPFNLAPFAIPEVGRLRVRAHYSDGSILKLGSIAVRIVDVEQFNRMVGLSGTPATPAPEAK